MKSSGVGSEGESAAPKGLLICWKSGQNHWKSG